MIDMAVFTMVATGLGSIAVIMREFRLVCSELRKLGETGIPVRVVKDDNTKPEFPEVACAK